MTLLLLVCRCSRGLYELCQLPEKVSYVALIRKLSLAWGIIHRLRQPIGLGRMPCCSLALLSLAERFDQEVVLLHSCHFCDHHLLFFGGCLRPELLCPSSAQTTSSLVFFQQVLDVSFWRCCCPDCCLPCSARPHPGTTTPDQLVTLQPEFEHRPGLLQL